MPRKNVTKPPTRPLQSRPYDLFSTFFGDAAELSNTIGLWDAIPKYAVSARAQNKMRNADGRLPVYEQSFVYATRYKGQRVKKSCRVEVYPTPVKTENGHVDFYPSTDEELIEEVIKKIFSDQQCGIHDPDNTESWVRFSLQMIRKELQARGKTRSLVEIKRSIDILSTSVIRLYEERDNTAVYTNPILTEVTRVTRQRYLKDGSLTWVAKLPALISKSVNELTYRQFNYGVLMSLPTQLARWLHKRLSQNYINASHLDTHDILFSSIHRDSGLLIYKRTRENFKALEAAFDELVGQNVLHRWERLEERRAGRGLADARYVLHAHSHFIRDIKAANARLKESRTTLAGSAVDKLIPGGR
jgi:hypothetical protein